jgi:ribokinase
MEYRYDVVGMGIASWDLIGVASRDPLMGGKQPLERWIETSGGPVATALVTLARLGMRPCMVGAVGNDGYGSRIIADLQQEGVATEAMQVFPGTSHVAFALVEPDTGRRTIWWHNDRAVLDRVSPDRTLITSARALHLDTHMPDVALQAARWMHEAGRLVMIDAERYKEQTAALLPYCTAIVVSERFGREASGEEEPPQAALALYRQYRAMVVVTAGERGSWCVSHDDAFHTSAFTVPVVDTTGAGDVFHGALLYGLLNAWSLRECVRFASATAALKCRAFGGRAGIPRLNEVQAMLHSEGW